MIRTTEQTAPVFLLRGNVYGCSIVTRDLWLYLCAGNLWYQVAVLCREYNFLFTYVCCVNWYGNISRTNNRCGKLFCISRTGFSTTGRDAGKDMNKKLGDYFDAGGY
jgi:hypothetical protein